MRLLSDDELKALRPGETAAFAGLIPTQIVSSDEYFPLPQSPLQRRVEALTCDLGDAHRRLEIPEDMQKQHGFAPLGPADGPIKRAIFGENIVALYGYRPQAELSVPTDRLAAVKAEYAAIGEGRSNLRYGYVLPRR